MGTIPETSNPSTKTCPKCKSIKPITEFFRNKNRKDGHNVYCKICLRAARVRSFIDCHKPEAEARAFHELTQKSINDSGLTAEILKTVLSYNPITGMFTWIKPHKRGGAARAGDVAGDYDSKGYGRISIYGKRYQAHRLVFLYMTGRWPVKEIDHINGTPDDNRWVNLREADRFGNMWNIAKSKRNTSGFKGVSWNARCKKWAAQAGWNGSHHYLGVYETIDQASCAYERFARLHHGEFYRI